MRRLDIKIDDLANPEYETVVKRASDRIEEAILFSSVSQRSVSDDIEIPSFPIAIMMVASTANRSLKRRYALIEAKRVFELLARDSDGKLIEIAKNFNWKIKNIKDQNSLNFTFKLYFTYFLKNASIFREKKWKLANRVMVDGEVYLTKTEAARLLEEEVRRHIEEKMNLKVRALPQSLQTRIERLKNLFIEKRGEKELSFGDFPKKMVVSAFPPCIERLYDAATSGSHISHIGRFTLTSFLTNIGVPVMEVIRLFRSFSDFNERMTRYQVEHIAGEKGSRTKYTPPNCETLRTHGICPKVNGTCKTIRHPLNYYRIKARSSTVPLGRE